MCVYECVYECVQCVCCVCECVCECVYECVYECVLCVCVEYLGTRCSIVLRMRLPVYICMHAVRQLDILWSRITLHGGS